MNRIKRWLKIFLFVCLMLLAMAGIGIPIPMFLRDRFGQKEFHQEQIDEAEEEDESNLTTINS